MVQRLVATAKSQRDVRGKRAPTVKPERDDGRRAVNDLSMVSQVALPGRPAAASAAVCWLFQGQRQSRRGDVRVSTAFNRMLGLPGAWVRDVEFGRRR